MSYDLNVPYEAAASCIKQLIKYGYTGAAITEQVSGKVKGTLNPKPLPFESAASLFSDTKLKQRAKGFKILRRVTVLLTDQREGYTLSGGSLNSFKKFDIVAVQPSTEKLLSQCVDKLDVDIVSLELTRRLPFYIKTAHFRQAKDRGVVFEVQYAPAIEDDSARRHTISNGQGLVRISKGHHLLLTSGASNGQFIRPARNVATLARLFGFTHAQAYASIDNSARQVLYHGEMRTCTNKGVLGVTRISELKPDEAWKVPKPTSALPKSTAVTLATTTSQTPTTNTPTQMTSAVSTASLVPATSATDTPHTPSSAKRAKQQGQQRPQSGGPSSKRKKKKQQKLQKLKQTR
eukprot:m.153088 g.153088  ORF g.153088 m.153088 type:complete len:348 (+) comp14280_c0_seq5:22-1065(+)